MLFNTKSWPYYLLNRLNMKVKVVEHNDWNLELVPDFVKIESDIDWNTRTITKRVIDIIKVSSEDFEISLNCWKKERNDLIFSLIWQKQIN